MTFDEIAKEVASTLVDKFDKDNKDFCKVYEKMRNFYKKKTPPRGYQDSKYYETTINGQTCYFMVRYYHYLQTQCIIYTKFLYKGTTYYGTALKNFDVSRYSVNFYKKHLIERYNERCNLNFDDINEAAQHFFISSGSYTLTKEQSRNKYQENNCYLFLDSGICLGRLFLDKEQDYAIYDTFITSDMMYKEQYKLQKDVSKEYQKFINEFKESEQKYNSNIKKIYKIVNKKNKTISDYYKAQAPASELLEANAKINDVITRNAKI